MERVNAFDEILAALAIRDAVRDPRYFVGRKVELGKAAAIYSSSQPGAFIWIHGPRRLGKTSVSFELLRLARERDALYARVDADTLGKDISFDRLLEAALANLSEPMAPGGGEPWTRFAALARASRRPLLFVFDEMDRMGPCLSEEEQGKLRALKQECPTLRCVFISRIDPYRLVEDYPLVSSRLLGVCNFIRLNPLSRREVRDLCTEVRRDLALAGDGRVWADLIWTRVGGHSVCVMGLVQCIAVVTAVDGSEPEDLERVLDSGILELRADLEGYWWDLPPRTRAALVQISEQTPREWQTVGLWEHDEPVRPSALVELGQELGQVRRSAPSERRGEGSLGCIDRIHSLMASVNDSLKLRDYPQPFILTSELFKYSSAVRGGEDREGARGFIDYMYKLLYESAREQREAKPWRLPPGLAEFYKGHPVVGDVSDLRSFFFHDQNRPSDSDRPSRNFNEAATILDRRCGTSDPRTTDHWRRLRDSVLDDAVALLEDLYFRTEAVERATRR